MTVSPSNDVAVNQSVTLHCQLGPNPFQPIVANFEYNNNSHKNQLCTLEPDKGVCKNTSNTCRDRYNANCPSDTQFSIQLNVPREWNGNNVICRSAYNKSDPVVFYVKGIV